MKKNILFWFCLICCVLQMKAQQWTAVANGVEGTVSCFAVYNGELYIGGKFSVPNATQFVGLLRWDGNTLDTLPGVYQLGTSEVNAMTVFQNELHFTGRFCSFCLPMGGTMEYIGKWNGTAFTAVGAGLSQPGKAMETYDNALYVGGIGELVSGLSAYGVAKWDGAQWSSIGGGYGMSSTVAKLKVFNGELYAAGNFHLAAANTYCIARWNGNNWRDVGQGGINRSVNAIGTYGNGLYAGGLFHVAGGDTVPGLARWDGTVWTTVGAGIVGPEQTYSAFQSYHGALFVGGNFLTMDGDSMNCIAQFDGNGWSSVGTGIDSAAMVLDTFIVPIFGDTIIVTPPHLIEAFQEYNGDLYVGGSFNQIGGVHAHNLAKWNMPILATLDTAHFALELVPQPADDHLKLVGLDLAKPCDLKLYNTTGQMLMAIEHFSSDEIDIHALPNGIYVLHVEQGRDRCNKRFLVCH